MNPQDLFKAAEDPLEYVKVIQNMSWKDLGYNSNMVIMGAEEKSGHMLGVDMDGYLEDGALNSSLIQNLNWSKGKGGELTLGGAGNTSGLLKVLDQLGIDRVIIDKSGITINDGKITIYDEDGSTALDSKGIVSTTQFTSGTIFDANLQTTTSTSLVNVTGTSITFTLDRQSKVFFGFDGIMGADNTGAGELYLVIDGVPDTNSFFACINAGANSVTVANTCLATLGAGSHTVKLQMRSFNGIEVSVAGANLTYVVLGK